MSGKKSTIYLFPHFLNIFGAVCRMTPREKRKERNCIQPDTYIYTWMSSLLYQKKPLIISEEKN